MTIFDIITVCALAIFLGLEFTQKRFRRSLVQDKTRQKRNFGFAIAALATIVLINLQGQWMRGIVIPRLEYPSLWLEIPLCFLLGEFFNYILHYVKHSNKFLWNFHFQHHRESEYNVWIVCHTHGLEVFLSGLLVNYVIISLGITQVSMQVYLTFYSIVNTLQHSSLNYSLGPFDYLIVGPKFHRHHHLKVARGNYGSTLTIFDWIFGTAISPAIKAEGEYGIEDTDKPFGFWSEMLFFLRPLTSKRPEELNSPLPSEKTLL